MFLQPRITVEGLGATVVGTRNDFAIGGSWSLSSWRRGRGGIVVLVFHFAFRVRQIKVADVIEVVVREPVHVTRSVS